MDTQKGIRYFKIWLTAGVHAERVRAAIIATTGIQDITGLNLGSGTVVLRFLVFLLSFPRYMNKNYVNILSQL
jgi:hypothetical protein